VQGNSVDVQEVVADFVRYARQVEPVVIGLKVAGRIATLEDTDPFADLLRFAGFNRKSHRVYGLNFPTFRYIFRKPYARFLRPVTKALRNATSLMRDIAGRQEGLEMEIGRLQREVAMLRSRIAQLEQNKGSAANVAHLRSN
jgi:hypothetical protein